MYAYNPRKKTYPQLKESLVGDDRWDILNTLMKELSLKKNEPPKQHWMIVGPRGMGKSHLLTLLYHKVGGKLRKLWIPVLFPEELRMANNLAKFLERAARETEIELARENNPISNELAEKIKKVKEIPASERIDYLFSVFLWLHQTTGRFILFLTENVQQLMGKKISVIELKKLRAFLQSHDAILFITSATTIFDALHDHKHPFYHFFHIKRLEDLSFESMKKLISRILSESDKPEKSEEVSKHEARLKALYSFTGGNPRLAVFLADILKTEVPAEMIEVMDRILDELTPYFDAILNDMPDYQEEILNTLAEHEPAQSPKEIAEHLETPQATIRNYIKHLKESGYVRIAFSKGKSNYYCINEYLYRVWYQMRDSSHREETRWLMELLLMLYSPDYILEEKKKLEECAGDINLSSYKTLIDHTASFISKNPDYCKVIELCIDSMSEDVKKQYSKKEIKLLEKAEAFVKNKNYNKAIKICQKTIKINTKQSMAYNIWALCLESQNKYKDAINICRKALKITPNDEFAYSSWGQCLVELKRYDEAIKKFKKTTEINPDSSDAFWGWGDCLREQNKYEKAIGKFEKAIKLKPNFFEAHGALGDCFRDLGRHDDAEKKYKQALKINPKYLDAYFAWVGILWEQSKFEQAIEKYKKILEIETNSWEALLSWGDCLRQLCRFEEAIEKYKTALEIKPDSEYAYFAWGYCLRKLNHYNEAIEKIEKAIEISPKDYVAHGALGDCFRDLGRHDDAEKKYKQALKINPKYLDAYFAWSSCLKKQKRYDDAIEKYKEALKNNPNSQHVYRVWIETLNEMKEYRKAAEIFESHLMSSENCLDICNYAKCLMELKRYEKAAKQLKKVIDLEYYCPQLYLSYGKALEKSGNKEDALIAFINHIRFNPRQSFIDLEFENIFKEYISPVLSTLKPEKYLKQFYAPEKKRKLSKPRHATFLLLLDKYDSVTEHFSEIIMDIKKKDKKTEQEIELLIFTIKLCLWRKLPEERLADSIKLIELFKQFIMLLGEVKEKETEVSNLVLGLFKLQANNKKIETVKIREILKHLEKDPDVPFSDIFMKIWTCMSEPDSIKAQKYLREKGIAETVKEIKNINTQQKSACN